MDKQGGGMRMCDSESGKGKQGNKVERGMQRMLTKLSMRLNWRVSG